MSNGIISLNTPGYGEFSAAYWNGLIQLCYGNGLAEGYICQLDAGLNLKQTLAFNLPEGWKFWKQGMWTPSAMPVITSPAASGADDLLLFLPASSKPSQDLLNAIYYYSVSRNDVRRLGASLDPGDQQSCWVTASEEGVWWVGCPIHEPRCVRFSFFPWSGLEKPAEASFKLNLPAGVATLNALTCAVILDGVATDGTAGKRLVLAGDASDDQQSLGLHIAEVPLQFIDGVPSLDDKQTVWTATPPWGNPTYWVNLASLTLQTAPDGRLWLFVSSQENWLKGQIARFYSSVRNSSGQWQMTALDDLLAPAISPTAQPIMSVVYQPGTVEQTPSQVNPALDDAMQPLARFILAAQYDQKTSIQRLSYLAGNYGHVRRRALPQFTPAKKVLLGIIEGPPPIPIENMNMAPDYDPRPPFSADTGNVAITNALEQSDTLTVEAGLGFVMQAEGETEGFAVKEELSLGYTGVQEETSTTICQTSNSLSLTFENITDTNGNKMIAPQPNGQAFVYGADCTGYVYEFVDDSGQTPAGSLWFLQLIPVNPHVAVLPYVMSPHCNPYPGHLLSYVLTEDERAALAQQAVFQFDSGDGQQSYLSTAWSAGGGKISQSYASYNLSKWTNKIALDAKLMAGAAIDGGCLGKGKSLFGMKINMSVSWGDQTGQRLGLSTDVGTLGNIHAPESFTSYVYDTYQLAESTQWASDLLNSLIERDAQGNITWPTDPHELAINQALADTIGPGSTPWKICYALGPYHFNQQLRDVPLYAQSQPAMVAQNVTAAPTLAAAVTQVGIETTAQLECLLLASRQPVAHQEAALGPFEAETAEKRAALLTLTQRLSQHPTEQQFCERVLQAAQAQALTAWQQAHPSRARRFGAMPLARAAATE